MRRLLAVIGVLAALPAAAAPQAGAGYHAVPLPVALDRGSGVAPLGHGLVFTDLGTGRIRHLDAAGAVTAIGPALPHGPDVLQEPTGPYKVRTVGDRLILSQGWTPMGHAAGPFDHALLELGRDGVPRVLSDAFWNPYDFEPAGDVIYVVDAGRNAVMRLRRDGAVEELFAFPRLEHDGSALNDLSPTEFAAGESYALDAVPTGIALGGDRLYVALFGGFPFVDGGGAVVSLDPAGGEPAARLELRGLAAPVDLEFDPAGRLLVLEHGRFDLAGGFRPGSGRLLRVDPDTGERVALAGGLDRPATVLARTDGSMVVTQMDGPALLLVPTTP